MFFLEVSQVCFWEATVLNVPTKSREFHDKDHLGSSDVDSARVVDILADYVVHRHVSHEKNESNPWHVRRVDPGRDEVGTTGTDDESPQTGPHIEEADQVEHGDGQKEDILFPWFLIRYSLQKGSQRVRQIERGDELD